MNKITEFLEDYKKEIKEPSIVDFTWNTDYDLPDNSSVMNEWLEEHIPEEYKILEDTIDGTYVEIIDNNGHKFACHASGNGDFYSHKIEFELLEMKNNLVYKDILDNDDLQALDKLVNEKTMTEEERKHYIEKIDWNKNIELLKEDGLFDKQQIKALKKLTSEISLTNAEKRYYIEGSNIKEILNELTKETQKNSKVNNIKKIRSNNVPHMNYQH